MTAQHTGARRNRKRGATHQQTELHAVASKPALGLVSISATSALDKRHHGDEDAPEGPSNFPAIPADSLV